MDKNVPPGAAILLDFIGNVEAPRGYDTIFANRQAELPKPVTQCTVDEMIAGRTVVDSRSSATGRYQFMRDTMKSLKAELGLRGGQALTPDLQDRLAYHLLRRRGYDEFVKGNLSIVDFGKRVAMEWASMPVLAPCQGPHRYLARGQSYYAGDSLNKALVPADSFEAFLKAALLAASHGDTPPAAQASPVAPVQPAPLPKPPLAPSPVPAPPVADAGGSWWERIKDRLREAFPLQPPPA